MHQFLQRKYMSIPGFGERKPVVVLTSSAVRELCFATRFLPALLFLSPHAAFLCISISCIPTVLSPLLLLCSLHSPSLGFLSSLTLSSLCFLFTVWSLFLLCFCPWFIFFSLSMLSFSPPSPFFFFFLYRPETALCW